MCVIGKHLQITNSVVGCACPEDVSRAQSGKDSESTCRTAGDRHSLPVNLTSRDEVLDAGDRILHVDDTPVLLQPRAVLTAVA